MYELTESPREFTEAVAIFTPIFRCGKKPRERDTIPGQGNSAVREGTLVKQWGASAGSGEEFL